MRHFFSKIEALFLCKVRTLCFHFQGTRHPASRAPELNSNIGMIIKSVKHQELNTKIMIAVLNTQTLKIILYYTNVYVAVGITKKILMKT